jgi:hypothetical protein
MPPRKVIAKNIDEYPGTSVPYTIVLNAIVDP